MFSSEKTVKINFKLNLIIAWIGCFFTGTSFSLVMPFISLYIEQLGVPARSLEMFSGLAISVTALASALITPFWGGVADRKGRKLMMVRAAVAMTFTMGALAFVTNVYWLLFFRLLTGIFSGYVPNATALIASQASKKRTGLSLGTLATGVISGNLVGPIIGGILSDLFGMKNVFLITGTILGINSLLTIFLVKENFKPITRKEMISTKEIFKKIVHPPMVIGLFFTSLVMYIGFMSISPILTLFIRELSSTSANIMFVSGLIVSLSGISSIISSPILGKLGDKFGNHRILILGLIFMILVLIPMSFVTSTTELGLLRFLMGFASGAMMPAVNSLLTHLTPREGISRIFSFNQTFANFGQVLGPLLGSSVARTISYRAVFIATSICLGANLALCLFNFRKIIFKTKI